MTPEQRNQLAQVKLEVAKLKAQGQAPKQTAQYANKQTLHSSGSGSSEFAKRFRFAKGALLY